MTRTVSGVILAAGLSSRLGWPKQLLPLHGKPLLQHVLDAAVASTVDDIVLVLGAHREAIAPAIQTGRARVVENVRYAEGQSTSLVAGLLAVDPDASAVLFFLGDQPAVTTETIDRIVAAYREADALAMIVAPRYDDGTGNPFLFDRALWPELLRITGDIGARDVVRGHQHELLGVAVAGLRPADVDTWDDYRLIERA